MERQEAHGAQPRDEVSVSSDDEGEEPTKEEEEEKSGC